MSTGLILVLVVVAAYLAAHVAFRWIARRFLIVSGAEYLLLGVLLGPQVSGVIQTSTVDGFAPLLTLAFGWVGCLIGLQFHVRDLARVPSDHFRIAGAEAGLTLVAAAGMMAAVCHLWLGLTPEETVVPAVVFGIVAVSSAPAGIAVASRRLRTNGFLARQLQVTTAIDALVAITAFGVLLAVARPGAPETAAGVRVPTPTEWVVITLAIGLVSGWLFHLFVRGEDDTDRLFIAMAGALILASGAAAYLRLSPLLPALLIGFVLVNTSPGRDRIREVLARVERPLYFVLLIFAGAAWEVGGRGWVLVPVVFLVVRGLAKVGSATLAARLHGRLDTLGPRWGVGLTGHGGLAVAIALNHRLYDPSPTAALIFSATLASVLVTDAASARLVEALMRSEEPDEEPARGRRLRRAEREARPPEVAPGGGGR